MRESLCARSPSAAEAAAARSATVLAAGCDTFVTADLKYNQFEEAKYRGLNLIDAGHFETENPVCDVLERDFAGGFPGDSGFPRADAPGRDAISVICAANS